VKNDIKALVCVALFLMLVLNSVVFLNLAPTFRGENPTVATYPPWEGAGQGAENPEGVAKFLFGPFALPLIVLSTALLVALVGALALAKPDPEEDSL
jgi:NADH:ubiquinone oxidoreductase subunit 6 (subunit J)